MAEQRTTIFKPKFRPWRVGRLVVVLLGGVALAHAAWDWHTGRALRQRVDALRAGGERVLPDDFATKQSVNTYENAARDLRAAIAIVDDDSEHADTASWVPSTRPVDPRAWPYMTRATEWFEPAIRRVARAQAKPVCDWEHCIPSPALDLLLPELNGLRSIQHVLVTSALVEHRARRDDRVVRRFGQILYLGDTCARTPAAVAHLIALGTNGVVAMRVEELGPDLQIGAAPGNASADDVRKLIATLLDETTIASGFETAMQAERMTKLDAAALYDRDRELGATAGYLARPWLQGQGRVSLDRSTRVIEALRGASGWPTAAGGLDALPPMPKRAFLADVLDMRDVMRRTAETHFLALTDRRLAATALAIRLYEVEHGGERPQRLEELVPKYLPKVPLDAMASGGRPTGYLPRAEHPVLYSVGRNGVDDAAAESAMPNAFGEIDEWGRLDRVFYLSGRQREYIYIARPIRPGDGMYAAVMGEGRPPWERDGEDASAATQPASPPDPPAQPAASPGDPAFTPR